MTHNEYEVELPGGGRIRLMSEDEVDRWSTLDESYRRDYKLTKINDLTMLGSILMQHIAIYRAQRALSGIEDVTDEDGLPTGRVRRVNVKPATAKQYQETIGVSSKEIRAMEQALGIDKKSREAGGKDTIQDYLMNLKKLGRLYGVHISERVKAYEELAGELRWRIRLLENGDQEDITYHDCTAEGILRWAKDVLDKLEEKDKEWAQQIGKVYVGTV